MSGEQPGSMEYQPDSGEERPRAPLGGSPPLFPAASVAGGQGESADLHQLVGRVFRGLWDYRPGSHDLEVDCR